MAPPNYLHKFLDAISVRNNFVGIGTDIPLGILHVNGKAYIDNITSVSSNLNFNNNTLSNIDKIVASTITTVYPSSNIDFDDKSLSNIHTLYVSRNGFIGGTLTASNLNILGDYTILNTGTSNTEQMVITNIGTGPALRVTQSGVGTEFAIAEFIDAESSMALKIADTGLVGINTDAPTERLHVYDTSNVVVLVQNASSGQSMIHFQNQLGNLVVGSSATSVDILSTANQPMRIGTNSTTSLTVLPSGEIGIATTQPNYQLDIQGTLAIRDAVYLKHLNMNKISYIYGGVNYSTTGLHTIGLRMTWPNTINDNKYAFRVTCKFHIASSTPSAAYRRFDSIVTPADDIANNRPCQISIAEQSDMYTSEFTGLSHSIARHSSNAVNLVVSWNANVEPAIGNLSIEVFANQALGDITFTTLSS